MSLNEDFKRTIGPWQRDVDLLMEDGYDTNHNCGLKASIFSCYP